MDNIERLRKYINRVEGLIANTKERIASGEGCLDIQLDSLEYHLDDLRKQHDIEEIREALLSYGSYRGEEYYE